VNIQGDEPLLRERHFELLVPPVTSGECLVSTLKVAISWEDAKDPNKVKVVTDKRGRALYFSRCPIPYLRGEVESADYYKHIGVYAYHREALERFYALPKSPLEVSERLEQLRFLENCIPIRVVETTHDTVGVDTEEDLKQVEAILGNR
jgi:3-deoxy-manno-octulosonate cytidylyltransferase (CMP-KDO synthetase)